MRTVTQCFVRASEQMPRSALQFMHHLLAFNKKLHEDTGVLAGICFIASGYLISGLLKTF